jgi:hypothetical protein
VSEQDERECEALIEILGALRMLEKRMVSCASASLDPCLFDNRINLGSERIPNRRFKWLGKNVRSNNDVPKQSKRRTGVVFDKEWKGGTKRCERAAGLDFERGACGVLSQGVLARLRAPVDSGFKKTCWIRRRQGLSAWRKRLSREASRKF